MAIVVRCDECGALLKCRDAALGKKVKCTRCRGIVVKKVKCTRCRGIVEVIPISQTPAGATDDEGAFASNPSAAVASGEGGQVFPVTRDRPVASQATGKRAARPRSLPNRTACSRRGSARGPESAWSCF